MRRKLIILKTSMLVQLKAGLDSFGLSDKRKDALFIFEPKEVSTKVHDNIIDTIDALNDYTKAELLCKRFPDFVSLDHKFKTTSHVK